MGIVSQLHARALVFCATQSNPENTEMKQSPGGGQLSRQSGLTTQSLGGSAWNGDEQKLEEVLSFQNRQRSSTDLLKEFKSQRSNRGASTKDSSTKGSGSSPAQSPKPIASPTSTRSSKSRSRTNSTAKNAGTDGTSAWAGDKKKLDEVLRYQNRQRTSSDLLAEFKAEKRNSRNSSPAGSLALPGPSSSQPQGVLVVQEEVAEDSIKSTGSQFNGGDWEGDKKKLDEVLQFHQKQRSSHALLEEFKSQHTSPCSSPSSSRKGSVRGSPNSVRGAGSPMMSELGSMSPPCASPMIGGLDGDATAMAEIDQLSSSKASDSQGFRAGEWEGDKKKLDEVLAFHSRQRSSGDLLNEFRAEQRTAKSSSRNVSRSSSKGSRSPTNGSRYSRDRSESYDSVTF